MLISDAFTIMGTGVRLLIKQAPYYPLIASFDITNRCTLKCKHCYWWGQEHESELSDEVFLEKLTELKKRHPSLLQGVWLGGEPLLRQGLVEKGMKLFSFNEVITNGTISLPNWKGVRFACSVDGTKEFHEKQRGKNSYEKIKKNIDRSDLNVNINCVITKLNQECLEEFVAEWRETNLRSIGFSFFTPILHNKESDKIWLDFLERDRVIERLLELKQKYGDFISSSKNMLENFRSDRCQGVTEKCRRDFAPAMSMCFDASFKRKFPCVIGEDADCSRCGCVAAVLGQCYYQGDLSFLYQHIKHGIPLMKFLIH